MITVKREMTEEKKVWFECLETVMERIEVKEKRVSSKRFKKIYIFCSKKALETDCILVSLNIVQMNT